MKNAAVFLSAATDPPAFFMVNTERLNTVIRLDSVLEARSSEASHKSAGIAGRPFSCVLCFGCVRRVKHLNRKSGGHDPTPAVSQISSIFTSNPRNYRQTRTG